MKSAKRLIVIVIFVLSASLLFAQPPDPNGGNNPNSGNGQVGGNAPIGGGLLIMLGLGVAYAGKKLNKPKNQR